MRVMLIAMAVMAAATTYSDEPRRERRFTSSNGQYRLAEKSGLKWQLTDNSGKPLYSITGTFSSCTALVSDDGQSVVVFDDYSEQEPASNLTVLSFYNVGRLVKQYSLGELLRYSDNICASAGHWQWLQGYDERQQCYVEPTSLASFSSNTLSFTTLELTSYRFDITNGSILERTRDPALLKGTMFAYGDVRRVAPNEYRMEIWHVIHGSVPTNGTVLFTSELSPFPQNCWDSRGNRIELKYDTISCIIQDRKFLKAVNTLFNQCNFSTLTNTPSCIQNGFVVRP